ncbi:MAG: hypothetical protein IPK82_05215 [Polyangiaceae bacterium]|nr:hypothetical protein [Polyangiaceae bacterium]
MNASRSRLYKAANTTLRRLLPSMLSALLSAGLAGCFAANRTELTCPKQGGPPWVETKSAHFVVKTDLPIDEAKRIAQEAEVARVALLAALGAPPGEESSPVELIVFERLVDFEKLGPRPGLRGFYSPWFAGDLEATPAVVASEGLGYFARSLLLHELTHRFVNLRTRRIPWWLNEGLAEFYSTIRVEDGEIVLGEPRKDRRIWEHDYPLLEELPRQSMLWLPQRNVPAMDQLMGVDEATLPRDKVDYYYAGAHKFVQVLFGATQTNYKARYQQMTSAIMQGADGDIVFANAYKGVLMSEIEGAYQALLVDQREYVTRLPFKAPAQVNFTVRTMRDDEVHVIWSRVSAHFPNQSSPPEDFVLKGLEENPGSPDLLYTRAATHIASGTLLPMPKEVEAYLKADPNDPRRLTALVIWLASRVSRTKDGDKKDQLKAELTAAADRLVAVANSPMQRTAAAQRLLELGRADEALVMSIKSVENAPQCSMCHETLAEILLYHRHFAEAKAAALRARSTFGDHRGLHRFDELLSRIDEAEKEAKQKGGKPDERVGP